MTNEREIQIDKACNLHYKLYTFTQTIDESIDIKIEAVIGLLSHLNSLRVRGT